MKLQSVSFMKFYQSSELHPPKMALITDKTILKTKADQKPFTWKPLTSLEAIRISKALMTNKKRPKVNIVTGIEKRIKRGLRNTFKKAKTIATTRAVENPSIFIPGRI